MRTIVIYARANGRFAVHLHGAAGGEFDTLAEADAFAHTLQAAHGGPEGCRIVHRPGEPDDAA